MATLVFIINLILGPAIPVDNTVIWIEDESHVVLWDDTAGA